MSAQEKEKIFVELRDYHTNEFPDSLATPEMTELRTEFAELEEKIVTMLLSHINGKLAFVDLSAELSDFKDRVKITKAGDRKEDDNRKFFGEKIDQLTRMVELAKDSTFKLKIPRMAKVKA